jgi:hypothetical protein
MKVSRGAAATKALASKVLAPRKSGIEKSSSEKKSTNKKRKRDEVKDVAVGQPLSEVSPTTAQKLEEIEQYIQRSTEERVEEIEKGKNPGKVKRPMNAFMLYRKAFQRDAKEVSSEQNHQVLSKVCGQSWAIESDELRKKFSDWAIIERENHHKAHPGYKFTPSKPSKGKLKKLEDEDSDLEDYDWNGSGGGLPKRARIQTPNQDPEGDYMPSWGYTPNTSYPVMDLHGMNQGLNRSTYEFSNPGKPVPEAYEQDLNDAYYQTTQVHRSIGYAPVEDVVMRKTPSPGMGYPPPPHLYMQHGMQMPHQFGGITPQHHGMPVQHHQQHLPMQQSMHHGHMQSQIRHSMPQHMHEVSPQLSHHQSLSLDQRIDPSLMGQYPDLMPAQELHRDATNPLKHPWYDGELGENNDLDNHYAGPFVGMDDMLLESQASNLLRGNCNDWHLETLDTIDLDSSSWMDAIPVGSTPSTIPMTKGDPGLSS